jgi:hypothetical protein
LRGGKEKNYEKNSRHFVSVCQYFGDLRFAVSFSPFSFCQNRMGGIRSIFDFGVRQSASQVRFRILQSDSRLFILIQFFAWFFSANVSLTNFSTEETRDLFITKYFCFIFQIYKYL